MRRAVEGMVFVALALAAHIWLAAIGPEGGGSRAAGDGGTALVSLDASDAKVAALVERWETAPEPADRMREMNTPSVEPSAFGTPRAPAISAPDVSTPVQPAGPGLPVPRARTDKRPDAAVTRPAAMPEPGTARVADTRPKIRPARPAPPRKAASAATARQKKQPATGAIPAQRASGQGGGANAGTAERDQTATLSADRRASLAARWGAEVRRRVERRKRYPGTARRATGTAQVRITLGRDGGLHGVAVVRSSGNAALDAAAMQAVRAAGRFPPAPKGLTKPSYSFTLPMRFSS